MKLKISSIKDILSDELTLEQRGLLITILLLKESDSKLTLAKVKTKVNMKKNRLNLMLLHKRGFINWSGYSAAVKSVEEKQLSPDLIEAVDFMNKLWGRRFGYKSKDFVPNLIARLKEHGLENVKKVISNRYFTWKDDKKMSIHLEPSTIFRPSKFPKYLENAERTQIGSLAIAADNINLNQGDTITPHIVQSFVDSETYLIKIYNCDSQGNKRGNGTKTSRLGKDIKRMVTIQENLKKRGLQEHVYIYLNQ